MPRSNDATITRDMNQFREHLASFLVACALAKRVKTLWGISPHE